MYDFSPSHMPSSSLTRFCAVMAIARVVPTCFSSHLYQGVKEDVTPAVPPVTFAKSAVTPLPPKPSVPQVQQVKAQAYVAVPIFYQARPLKHF